MLRQISFAKTVSFLRRNLMCRVVACSIAVWSLVVMCGMGQLWSYSMQPGPSSKAPLNWPTDVTFQRPTDRFTLVMAVHPRCPCTRASLQELAKIMRFSTQPVLAIVLVCRPEGTKEGFERTDIWEQADSIPGVHVQLDSDGADAASLGLAISGATSVYDENGRLAFSGGITSSRGHAGDNAGSEAVIAILSKGVSKLKSTPVYGCDLFAAERPCFVECSEEAKSCCQ